MVDFFDGRDDPLVSTNRKEFLGRIREDFCGMPGIVFGCGIDSGKLCYWDSCNGTKRWTYLCVNFNFFVLKAYREERV